MKHQSSSIEFKTRTPFFQKPEKTSLGKRAFLFFKFFEKRVFRFLLFFESSSTTAILNFRSEADEIQKCGESSFLSAALETAVLGTMAIAIEAIAMEATAGEAIEVVAMAVEGIRISLQKNPAVSLL